METAYEYAKETGTVCVLKDACTVTAGPSGETYLNLSGNAGLASCRKRRCVKRCAGGSALHVSLSREKDSSGTGLQRWEFFFTDLQETVQQKYVEKEE